MTVLADDLDAKRCYLVWLASLLLREAYERLKPVILTAIMGKAT